MALTEAVAVWLASSAAFLALAALLLSFDFTKPSNRAFALLLVLRGMGNLCTGLVLAADDLAGALFWWRIYPYFLLPVPLVALYFLAVFPRGGRWRSPFAAAPFLLAAAALDVAYALDHTLYWDLAALQGVGPELLLAFSVPTGPLYPFFGLAWLAYGLIAVVAAREWLRAPRGPRGHGPLLVSLGFGLAVVDAAARGFALGNLEGGALGQALVAAALLAVLAAAALLAARAWPIAAARRYLGALALPALTALLLAALPLDPGTRAAGWLGVAALWRFALAGIVTYALVRHRLFDIDVQVRWAFKQSTLAAAFVGLFFVISELTASVLSESLGSIVGIAVAGLIVFALAPLHQAAERVALAAAPGEKAPGSMDRAERLEVYRQQWLVAQEGGNVTDKERRMLDAMRERLGLSAPEAARVEREALA